MSKYDKLNGLTWEDVQEVKLLWEQREKEKFDLDKNTIYEINGRCFLFDYIRIDSKTGEGTARFIRYDQDARYAIATTKGNLFSDCPTLTSEEVKKFVSISSFDPSIEINKLLSERYELDDMPMTKQEREDRECHINNEIRKVVDKCPHEFKHSYSGWGYTEEHETCQLCGYEITKVNDVITERKIEDVEIFS